MPGKKGERMHKALENDVGRKIVTSLAVVVEAGGNRGVPS